MKKLLLFSLIALLSLNRVFGQVIEITSDTTKLASKDGRFRDAYVNGVRYAKGSQGNAEPTGTKIIRNLKELRRFNDAVAGLQYLVADRKVFGFFELDPADKMSADDSFNVIVTTSGNRMKRVVDAGAVATGVQKGSLNAIAGSFVGSYDVTEGDVPSWGVVGMRYGVIDVRPKDAYGPNGSGMQIVSSLDRFEPKLSYRVQQDGVWSDFVDVGVPGVGTKIDTTQIAYKTANNTFSGINSFQKNAYFGSQTRFDRSIIVQDTLHANYILRVYDKAYFTNDVFTAGRYRNYLGGNIEFGDANRWAWFNVYTKDFIIGKQTPSSGRLQVGGDARIDSTVISKYLEVADNVTLNGVNVKAQSKNVNVTYTGGQWVSLLEANADLPPGVYLLDVIFSPGDHGHGGLYGYRGSAIINVLGTTNDQNVETPLSFTSFYGHKANGSVSFRWWADGGTGFRNHKLQFKVDGDGTGSGPMPVSIKYRKLL